MRDHFDPELPVTAAITHSSELLSVRPSGRTNGTLESPTLHSSALAHCLLVPWQMAMVCAQMNSTDWAWISLAKSVVDSRSRAP
jgi:hypothetical protein